MEIRLRKWRPTFRCIYVIPEIYGNIEGLEVILNRILPLRIFKNQDDSLIFLGNYIDGGKDSSKVIDCLINIKKEYGDRVIILRGKHEEMMLMARLSDNYFNYWIDNGGISTIESYVGLANINATASSIKRNRIQDIIPEQHIYFLKNLSYNYIIDNYCFFNSGFDHNKKISENNVNNFVFDYTSGKYIKDCVINKEEPQFKDDYVFVCSHNNIGNKPFLCSKYFMLGGGAPSKMFVFELNSMSACAASYGKSRIYKYNFNIYE